MADLKPENLLLRNLVNELIVSCPNEALGCTHTCQRQLLKSHLRDDCDYVRVACPEDGCDEIILRKNVGKPEHECTSRMMTCEACGTSVKAVEVEAHMSSCTAADVEVSCPDCSSTVTFGALRAHCTTECPATIIPCTEAAHGCPWNGKRSTLSVHTSTCPFTALAPYFAMTDTQTRTLIAENAIISSRLEAAETRMNGMRVELEAAKNALGPFWHEPASHMHTSRRETDSTIDERINTRDTNAALGYDISQRPDNITRSLTDSHQLEVGSSSTISSTTGTSSSRWRLSNGNTAPVSSSSPSSSSVPVGSGLAPAPGTLTTTTTNEQDRFASYFPLHETEADAAVMRSTRENTVGYPNMTSPDLSTVGMRTYTTSSAHHTFASRLFPNPPIRYVNDAFSALSLTSPPAGILSPTYSALAAYPAPSLSSPPLPGHTPAPLSSSLSTSALTLPPLDTSQPLLSTLSTLHTTTHHLATALDALARRTDGALAAADMRAGDEAGALRAAVHGLRMQVHALVTERAFGMGPGMLAANANAHGSGTNRSESLQGPGGGNVPYSTKFNPTRPHSPPPIRNTKL